MNIIERLFLKRRIRKFRELPESTEIHIKHYKLWDGIVEELKHGNCDTIYHIKRLVFNKLFKENPKKDFVENYCWMCYHYQCSNKDYANICPLFIKLGNAFRCSLYHNLTNTRSQKERIELAIKIRDIIYECQR